MTNIKRKQMKKKIENSNYFFIIFIFIVIKKHTAKEALKQQLIVEQITLLNEIFQKPVAFCFTKA